MQIAHTDNLNVRGIQELYIALAVMPLNIPVQGYMKKLFHPNAAINIANVAAIADIHGKMDLALRTAR